ncbi:hypothetical protein D9619_000124 [Psilocybe cf. subviscida]|uniref:PH domain-containing protein n=1 Tax=Psilocybe cf. subviscida TaxID=2480587 RepID=A0A8H5BFS2_9AGAR|nr:hypothetical protein D9619_000124 [Psilocybe cf. subviscida]
MSAFLGKAGKKLFEQHLAQYAPADPLYETYTTKSGKQKRRKRALPPGLSERDARILKSVKKRAHYLDKGFSICGLRFGWTFFIGLIPIVGDVTDASLNYFLVIRPARRADLPDWLVQRMLFNSAVSVAVGFVPFVGDVVMATFKTNSRNAALLEEFLRIRGEEFLKLGGDVPAPATKTGWFGSVGKGKQTAAGSNGTQVTASDVEQVKPGAGMSGNEMKDALLPNTTTQPVATTNKATSSGSSGFSFFGGRNKKHSAAQAHSSRQPEKSGKFIENMA